MPGREYDSPHEKLREEFEVLVGQNNTIVREMPKYTVANLLQCADWVRRKHNVDIVDVRDQGQGRYLVVFDEDGGCSAVLGVDRPGDIEDIECAMLDDRAIGRGL